MQSCISPLPLLHSVISPASQWPEWVTSVPLLFYSAISCDISRPSLDLTDVLIISSMGLTISTGFVLNISHFPAWVYHSMLFISCSAVSSVVLLAVFTNKQLVKQIHCAKSLHALEDETSCMTPRERFHRVEIQFKRLQYAMKKVYFTHLKIDPIRNVDNVFLII